ncbi:unnamed protein product [Parnassius apollo]|uniref:(apollo) hypothetical protein n=1 Tax=Parnassius apollo TaxID=110799 RepID=A0A8S3X0K6_PARAO|nr:unnamed protein product [Parnassius apollo]
MSRSKCLSEEDMLRILENSDEKDNVMQGIEPAVEDADEDDLLDTPLLPFEENRSVSPTPAQVLPTTWQNNIQDLPREEFTGYANGKRHVRLFSENTDLWTIFSHIYNEDVNQLMVEETNRYGSQMRINRNNKPYSRINRWKPVTSEEMRKFVGIYLLTGLLNFPSIESYWKNDPLYYHPLLHDMKMSYNRFSLILRCWHFSNNEVHNVDDRLYKIQPLINKPMNNSRSIYTPGETIVVDESMVGFRGRLSFRTYNPQKAHKYGIKIYKLCCSNGFTWSYSIYDGRSHQLPGLDKPGTVVVSLAELLLDKGRILIADNYYTSVPLARYLKERKTDFCGTVRKARRELPPQVIQQKLQKGQIAAQQNECVIALKWHDKRDVLTLSTCHSHEMQMSKGFRPVLKPKMVLTYNEGKKGIDIADQLTSFNSPVRKSCIWYKKIAADLLATCVVNAIVIYNQLHPSNEKNYTAAGISLDSSIIKIPRSIIAESVITINGTLNNAHNVLSVALLDEVRNMYVCRMVFDTASNIIAVESELTEPSINEYSIENLYPEMSIAFTVRMEARVYNGQQLINLYFEADNAGELPIDHCRIKNFNNIERIVIKGVKSISSLLFKYD